LRRRDDIEVDRDEGYWYAFRFGQDGVRRGNPSSFTGLSFTDRPKWVESLNEVINC